MSISSVLDKLFAMNTPSTISQRRSRPSLKIQTKNPFLQLAPEIGPTHASVHSKYSSTSEGFVATRAPSSDGKFLLLTPVEAAPVPQRISDVIKEKYKCNWRGIPNQMKEVAQLAAGSRARQAEQGLVEVEPGDEEKTRRLNVDEADKVSSPKTSKPAECAGGLEDSEPTEDDEDESSTQVLMEDLSSSPPPDHRNAQPKKSCMRRSPSPPKKVAFAEEEKIQEIPKEGFRPVKEARKSPILLPNSEPMRRCGMLRRVRGPEAGQLMTFGEFNRLRKAAEKRGEVLECLDK